MKVISQRKNEIHFSWICQICQSIKNSVLMWDTKTHRAFSWTFQSDDFNINKIHKPQRTELLRVTSSTPDPQGCLRAHVIRSLAIALILSQIKVEITPNIETLIPFWDMDLITDVLLMRRIQIATLCTLSDEQTRDDHPRRSLRWTW